MKESNEYILFFLISLIFFSEEISRPHVSQNIQQQKSILMVIYIPITTTSSKQFSVPHFEVGFHQPDDFFSMESKHESTNFISVDFVPHVFLC